MRQKTKKKVVIEVEDTLGMLVLPELKTEGAAGYDIHPTEVTLISHSGLYFKCSNEESIIKACEELKKSDKRSLWQRIKDFIADEQPNKGWKTLKFNTGLKIAPTEKDIYVSLEPCSRTTKTDYVMHNSLGTIDNDYRGFMQAVYHSLCTTYDADGIIRLFETCGQLKPKRAIEIEFVKKQKLSETVRGEGGFGSTSQLSLDN